MTNASEQKGNCENCLLKGRPFVPSYLPKPLSPLALVGEAPGDWEVDRGIPFVGYSGKLLRGVMSYLDYGVKQNRVGLINACSCHPEDNEMPKAEPKKQGFDPIFCCQTRLHNEISNYKVIVALGATALFGITGLRGIASWRGCVLGLKEGSWTPWKQRIKYEQLLVIARHPSFVNRTPLAKRAFLADLEKAVRLAKGGSLKWSEGKFHLEDPNSDQLLAAMDDGKPVAIDIETNGEHYCSKNFRITALGFAHRWGTVSFLWPTTKKIKSAVNVLLRNREIPKVFHNAQFDTAGLEKLYFKIYGPIYDTLLLHHSFAVGQPHSLEYLRTIFTDSPHRHHEYEISDREEFLRDNARHATVTLEILKPLQKLVDTRIYGESMKLAKLCKRMTHRGIMVHQGNRKKIIKGLTEETDQALTVIQKEKPGLNPASPLQVAALIYDDLGLPIRFWTKTNQRGTDKNVIASLFEHATRPQAKVLKALVDYRHLASLLSGMENLPILDDGAVHCRWNVHGAVTRRFSSTEPNMQNVRKDNRRAFVARPYMKFIGVDFKQLELRILAYLADDEPMIAAFAAGRDIHYENCIALYGLKKKYTNDERTKAKGFVFGGNYGAGVNKRYAMMRLDHPEITLTEVAQFAMNWDRAHPAIVRWQSRQMAIRKPRAQLSGYTLPFPTPMQCLNFPIQSTATDIVHLWSLQQMKRKELFPILQGHDCLVFECAKNVNPLFPTFKIVLNDRRCEFPLDVKEGHFWDEV